jgi:glycosyltransferase involved in cell wall biosynthesis
MFGESDYEAELRELVNSLGLQDRIVFTGFTDRVENELAQLDILVHASIVPEPFGQVIVEGMAAGLAVIAAAAGGPLEIVTSERDGLLVRPGDVAVLAAALRRLSEDVTLRQRLGSAAIERARDYAPGPIGARFLNLYREVLTAQGR